jgi:hypothetical protein
MSYLSKKLCEVFNYQGELPESRLFGIEVEVEASNSLPTKTTQLWRSEHDGSLRGNAIEYVLSLPLPLEETLSAVDNLYGRFRRMGSSLNDSMRAGVHVHVNQRHRTIQQVATLLSTYWLVEDILIREKAGRERQGNLFCLRLSDATYPLFYLMTNLQEQRPLVYEDDRDTLRYAAVNIAPLSVFGTLEFRALRTPATEGPLKEWIKLINRVCDQAERFSSPADLIDFCSGEGPLTIANEILGTELSSVEDERILYQAIRRIQPLAYLINWE